MKKEIRIILIVLIGSFCLISCNDKKKKDSTAMIKDFERKKEGNTPDSVKSEPISEKKKLIEHLIGDHSLKSISGSMGANTMIDFVYEKGKWTGMESSISEGMREAYDIDLTSEILKKLKSMKIHVSQDLSVSLLCKGKEYFKTPYKEDGLTYLLNKSPEEYTISMSEKLKPTSTFLNDYLYLYVKDNVNENEISTVNVTDVMADAIVIKYNTKTSEFEMNLFYGDCCDNAIFIFK